MSPYLEAAAKRAGIIVSHAETGARWPRTQREAGIEFRAWEGRIKPLRPIWIDLATAGICVAVMAAWALVKL